MTKAIFLAPFAGLISLSALAGGSIMGNGGSAVVCFSIPVSQAYQDHRITSDGAGHISAAYVFEYYRAMLKVKKSQDFETVFTHGGYSNALDRFFEKMSTAPGFRDQTKQRMELLGRIQDGVRVPDGLDEIPDSGDMIHLPENCLHLQAVARRNGQFAYDATIIDWMLQHDQGTQAGIMEMHEAVYDIGVGLGQTTSVPTQDLLVYLMTTDSGAENLPPVLEELGFTDQTATQCTTPSPSTLSFPAAPASGSSFSDDFSTYPLAVCQPDGRTFGPWISVYGGYGNSVVQLTNGNALSEQSETSASPSETHTNLVLGPSFSGDQTFHVSLKTIRQLRQGSPANPWEVGWVLWNETDDSHFYYFIPKPTGWELGKNDPSYPSGQRYIATGSAPSFPIGAWYDVQVTQEGNHIVIAVNGEKVVEAVDLNQPYSSGRIGLYSQDAHVFFSSVKVSASPSP